VLRRVVVTPKPSQQSTSSAEKPEQEKELEEQKVAGANPEGPGKLAGKKRSRAAKDNANSIVSFLGSGGGGVDGNSKEPAYLMHLEEPPISSESSAEVMPSKSSRKRVQK